MQEEKSLENICNEDSAIEKIVGYGIIKPVRMFYFSWNVVKCFYYKIRCIEYHWADNDLTGFDYVVPHKSPIK